MPTGKPCIKASSSRFRPCDTIPWLFPREGLPDCLEISAESEDGEIMGLRHKTHPTEGIQFHPESIMTPVGKRLLKNFLKITGSIS